jgi:hypothetical protein
MKGFWIEEFGTFARSLMNKLQIGDRLFGWNRNLTIALYLFLGCNFIISPCGAIA